MTNIELFDKATVGKKGSNVAPTIHPAEIKSINNSLGIIVAVLLVLVATAFFALGSILNDTLMSKQASFQDLSNEIEEQNQILREIYIQTVKGPENLEVVLPKSNEK